MFKSMKRIIRWAGKYRGRLYLGSVFSFFSSLSTAIPTMAAAYALDKSIQAYWAHTTIDASLIWKMLWIIVGSIALNFLFSYLRAILQESIGYEVAAGQRIHLGDVLKRVPLGYFSQNSVGDILAGVTTELSTLELQGMKMVDVIINGYAKFIAIVLYLGHTVNFKTTKKSYKSKKTIKNPESEWVIFENTHEPIWTEAIAEAVKQARQSRRRPTKMGEMGMFSGMMYCADCGSILYQCRATGFRKDQEYYICSGYRKGKQVCGTPHSIRTVILEELILQNLREIVSFARSHENRFVQMVMDMDVKERNKGLAKKRKLLSEGEKRITELDMIFKRLYEDSISGKLTDERFHKLSTDYEAEQAGLQAQAAILREEIEEVEGKSADVDRFLSVVRQYTDIPELTPRILHEFVEKIVIHSATDPHSKINRRQEVDIYYKGIGILEMSKVFDSRQK